MIIGVNDTDKDILKVLLGLRPRYRMSSRDISFEIKKSQVYIIQRLDFLNYRGVVSKEKQGRRVNWAIHPKLRLTVADTIGIPRAELKRAEEEAVKEEKLRREKEAKQFFAWGAKK